MNRLGIGLLLSASLFFIDISPAAAHHGTERLRFYEHAYQYQDRRHHDMPRWLKRDKRFRSWYRHSRLNRYRQIGWRQLFEVYRWEQRYYGGRYYYTYKDDHHRRRDGRRRHRDDD